ncbi:MAG: hypothetical protein FWB77_03070 [Treponema sp.]|nr:hypothetical protein [Treponema sp.]
MKTKRKFGWCIPLLICALLIGFAACDPEENNGGGDDDGDSSELPSSSGTNEFLGKTLYLDYGTKAEFANSGTTFTGYDYDFSGEVWKKNSEGSYSYNSGNKTISIVIDSMFIGGTKYNKTQYADAMMAEWDASLADIRANFDAYLRGMLFYDFSEELYDEISSAYSDIYGDDFDYDTWSEFLLFWVEEYYATEFTAYINAYKSENGITDADSFILAELRRIGANFNSISEYRAAVRNQYLDAFNTRTYEYQLTADNQILVQEKLPSNRGTDELKGKTFVYDDYDDYKITFSADGTFSASIDSVVTETGKYAYDSTAKKVWLQPTTRSGATISQYYTDSYGGTPSNKAADANSTFRIAVYSYSLTPNKISDSYF